MNSRALFVLAALLGLGAFFPALGRADGTLSADRLDLLDRRGYFTPDFKKAVHDLVDASQAVARAKAQEAKDRQRLPELQRQCEEARARVAGLRRELALYEHPEDADFEALQNAMKNPTAKPAGQLALAQAFVWSYPNDPHQAEAEQDLQQIQQQLSNRQQAVQDARAAQIAAQAKLWQRIKARELSLAEWQTLLFGKSQEDLLGYLGHPQIQSDGYWIYTGAWTTDPLTQAKVGLQINFNGTRVISVSSAPLTR